MNAPQIRSGVNGFRSLDSRSERSLFNFPFLFNFCQGPIRSFIFYRLVPLFQTITTSCQFIQIQRNQRPLLRYDPLFPVKQLKHAFESIKIWIQQIRV